MGRTRGKAARGRRTHVVAVLAPYLIGAALGASITAGAVRWWSLRQQQDPPPPDPVTTPATAYAWTDSPQPAFPIPPYARFLRGVKIVLDPGHVGQRDPGGDWKRGPTGLREAEVNLRVALFLREFLEAAGAEVTLTREEDRSLDLPDDEDLAARATTANALRADLLLSIHHNASASGEANYTTLFYHDADDHSLASLCAARHLLTGLNDALRLEQQLECAILNDRLLYKNGLGLLRRAQVPAVLSEASFHTNPAEEARLRDPAYNRREAYGLFLGLARWAQAGLPAVALREPANGQVRGGQKVMIGLDDGLSARGGWGSERLRILPDTIVVELDGHRLSHRLDAAKRQIEVTLPRRLRGSDGRLRVDFANVFGQHVLHPWIEFE